MSSEYKVLFDKALEQIKSVNYNRRITYNLKDKDRFNIYNLGWEENTDADFLFIEYLKKKRYDDCVIARSWLRCVRKKCGIEILGMNDKNKKGLYELRNACKINGMKGYSKFDKKQMVKLLMNL